MGVLPSGQFPLHKWQFGNSGKKLLKSRYHSFLLFSNILSSVVGEKPSKSSPAGSFFHVSLIFIVPLFQETSYALTNFLLCSCVTISLFVGSCS